MSSRGRILSLSCFSIMQYTIFSRGELCLVSEILLGAPGSDTACSRGTTRGEPLRTRPIDIGDAVGVALNLTIESVLALENQVQILALEVPNTLNVVASDEWFAGDACTTLFAGC
jgi:hypothetical protein